MRKFALYIMLFLISTSAAAEDKTEKFLFETYWSGFNVGQLSFDFTQSGDKYNIVNNINSKGVAKLVSNYSSTNIVSGIVKNGKFLPQTYHSNWWRKDDTQNIDMKFSDKGDVKSLSLVPPDREGKHPEVDKELKKNVFDPLTSAIVSRETIRNEIAKNPNSKAKLVIPTFDAKRRFDVICEIKGYQTININNKMMKLLHVKLTRKPLAGFNESDLKELEEEQQVIDFYVDSDFVPVWGEAKADVGSATIKRIK